MKKYVCSVCGYVYDEAKGDSKSGIAPGTLWQDLPENWLCPLCGATKSEFSEQQSVAPPKPLAAPVSANDSHEDMKELTPLEISALCSNLARGCEKQYKAHEASLFTELSNYFKSISPAANAPQTSQLLKLVEQDLAEYLPTANSIATQEKDRGALRALVWSEKVTRILNSLLARYEKDGDAMLESTGVYVCTICGFIYIGANPPELCPVCKVPSWKFEEIIGRAQ